MNPDRSNGRSPLEQAAAWVPSLAYFVDRRCLPTWRISRHEMAHIGVNWVLSGRATYWIDGESLTVQAGDLLCVGQGSVRQAVTDPVEPMHCLAMDLSCQTIAGEVMTRLPFSTVTPVGEPSGLRELYARLEEAWLEKDPGYLLEVRGLVSLILHKLAIAASSGPEVRTQGPRLRLVQRHIVKNYARPIALAELAALVRLHPRYFGTWFRQQTGLTVHQYINRIRVRQAAELLSTGGANVGEVAERCGFSDIFYFSKVFRRQTGRPPSDLLRR